MFKFTMIILASTLSASISLAAVDCKDEKNFPVIEKAELTALLEKKAVFVVDVNSKESFEKSHIPTAINFGMEKANFAAKLPADKNSLIVSYCGGPSCSAWKKAATEACKNGYTNIKHFKAGISGWNTKI